MGNAVGPDVLVQRPWGTKKVPGSSARNLEQVCVHQIGHAWGKALSEGPGQPATYFVQDFLLDQSGKTGRDVAKLAETVQFDLTLRSSYKYLVGPAVCARGGSVKVAMPQHAIGNVYFSAYLGRQATTGSTGGDFMPGTITATWLQGGTTVPTISYNAFSITQSNNSALTFEVEGELTADFQFGALLLEGDYPPRTFDPGQRTYYPLSYADPIGVGDLPEGMPTDGETFIVFGYTYQPSDATPTDPGPFVSIV